MRRGSTASVRLPFPVLTPGLIVHRRTCREHHCMGKLALATPALPSIQVHAPQRTEAGPFIHEAPGAVRRQAGIAGLTRMHSGHQRRRGPTGGPAPQPFRH